MKIYRPEDGIPWKDIQFRELTPEELKEAYALASAAFTADDLQRYTELDEGIPFEQVLAEMDEVLRNFKQGAQ